MRWSLGEFNSLCDAKPQVLVAYLSLFDFSQTPQMFAVGYVSGHLQPIRACKTGDRI